MTAETRLGHSGLLSGNTPGIQSRTSDIFFLYEMMSSEQLTALIIRLKPDRTGKKVPLTVLISFIPQFHYTWRTSTLRLFRQKENWDHQIGSFLLPKWRKVPSVCGKLSTASTSEVQTLHGSKFRSLQKKT